MVFQPSFLPPHFLSERSYLANLMFISPLISGIMVFWNLSLIHLHPHKMPSLQPSALPLYPSSTLTSLSRVPCYTSVYCISPFLLLFPQLPCRLLEGEDTILFFVVFSLECLLLSKCIQSKYIQRYLDLLHGNIQKTKIMASGPITSWEIDGETVETVSDFIFLGSIITADGDGGHEIKRHLLLGRKVMTNLDSIFKSRDITLPTKFI